MSIVIQCSTHSCGWWAITGVLYVVTVPQVPIGVKPPSLIGSELIVTGVPEPSLSRMYVLPLNDRDVIVIRTKEPEYSSKVTKKKTKQKLEISRVYERETYTS